MARGTSRSLTYPTNHLLGVVDDPPGAAAAARTLVAAGFAASDVAILRGAEGVERLEPSRGPERRWTQFLRSIQYMTMDQMPDFPAYVAALRDGRAIVAVHVRNRDEMVRARDVLASAGAHFMNYFGRFETEEVSRWRGPELPLSDLLRR